MLCQIRRVFSISINTVKKRDDNLKKGMLGLPNDDLDLDERYDFHLIYHSPDLTKLLELFWDELWPYLSVTLVIFCTKLFYLTGRLVDPSDHSHFDASDFQHCNGN